MSTRELRFEVKSIQYITDMMNLKIIFWFFLSFLLTTKCCPAADAAIENFVYEHQGEIYHYWVSKTGENYTFKFDKNPGEMSEKLTAGYHVLQSMYDDPSIESNHSQQYIKERARCFVFGSAFYTYTICFLPNEFSQHNRDRFWGFVTQIPNWRWLVTRNLLPAVLVFGLIFFISSKRKNS